NISAYHIQNVIRSYSQRMGRKNPSQRTDSGSDRNLDTISISANAKNAQLAAQLTKTIAQKTLSSNKDDKNEIEAAKRFIKRLAVDGTDRIEPDVVSKEEGGFRFKLLSPDNEETIKEFSFK
ncbi:MAG: DVU0524 family FlgM-associated protein, partial [Dissulfurimicrobium sp.]